MPPSTPEKLFYYCHASEAIEIIRNSSIPVLGVNTFNGVTELSNTTALRFDKDQLTKSTVRIASSLIFGPDDPKGNSPLVNAIRRWRNSQRFSTAEEAQSVLMELSEKLIEHRYAQIDKSLELWNEACSHLGFIRLFENHDKFALWDQYADNAQGAVIAFKTQEQDTLIASAVPVTYQDNVPEVTTLKEQVGALLYETKVQPEKNLVKKFSARPSIYKNEKEWRCITTENQGQTTHSIQIDAISSIYLGPGMSEQNKGVILSELSANKLPIRTFQSQFAKAQFDIQHTPIE